MTVLPYFTAKSESASYESRAVATRSCFDVLSAASDIRITKQLRATCSAASCLRLLAEGNKAVVYASRVNPIPTVVPTIVQAISGSRVEGGVWHAR